MAFMEPQIEFMSAYLVETNIGTECVPEDVCDDPTKLEPYLEGSRIESVDRKEGWFGRLSAPGYMDCTEWLGPFDTEGEARVALDELYD